MTVTRKRILCVENEEDTGDMMRVPLGGYGDEAINASSVSDALENDRPGELALAYLIIG
jgi:hypothetical protein